MLRNFMPGNVLRFSDIQEIMAPEIGMNSFGVSRNARAVRITCSSENALQASPEKGIKPLIVQGRTIQVHVCTQCELNERTGRE